MKELRTIKFRGKRKDTGKWVYGSHQHVIRKSSCELIVDWLTNNCIEVIPESIGQFVGIEYEGKEVYEDNLYRGYQEVLYKVIYDKECCKFILYLVSDSDNALFEEGLTELNLSRFRLVGNIHDNPDLIMKEK